MTSLDGAIRKIPSRVRSFDRQVRGAESLPVERKSCRLGDRIPRPDHSREGTSTVLRHVVLMRWKPGTSDAQKQAVREGLAALPAAIPEIQNYQFGDDAAIVEGNYEFAIVADFDNPSDFQTYAANDVHQKLIAERIRPILQDRAAVQYTI